jgi:hypothetical protein
MTFVNNGHKRTLYGPVCLLILSRWCVLPALGMADMLMVSPLT